MPQAGRARQALQARAARATEPYERRRPGELVHVDIKKLGRFAVAGKRAIGARHASRGFGWECVHVMIDDCSRLAYAEVLPDERGETAVGFLRRGLAWFARLGDRFERVMTDNGSPYVSTAHALACRELDLRHLRTRPYRPRTNGRAERFIQTLQNEWAFAPSTAAPPNEPQRCRPSATTTSSDDTAHSATNHRLPG